MKRITRRTLGVCLGLALGWYVAGLAPPSMLGLRTSMAEDTDHPAAPSATTQPSSESQKSATPPEPVGQKEGAHEENGPEAARQLVPRRPDQIPWFWPVIWSAAGLFIAAVVLGIPSLKLRGPLPPDPAHDDHDAHDDHGHDEHGTTGHH